MHGCTEPQINRWYTSMTGRLFRVKTYAVCGTDIDDIVLQFADGETQMINRHEWFCMQQVMQARA